MRITVCDFPDEPDRKEKAWVELIGHLQAEPSDIVVLPEMAFCYWLFVGDAVDHTLWQQAVSDHDRMIARLPELGVGMVLGSRPVSRAGRRLNEAFAWSADGYRGVRAKWYLPDAPDGRETLWFDQGDRNFAPVTIGDVRVGFQLCSEMMYPEHARAIGLSGGHLIAQPRATSGNRRWPIAAAMTAITSGCFVATANRRSFDRDWFPGGSWIISPEGEELAGTTPDKPFATAAVDLRQADRAKTSYPRDMHGTYARRESWPSSRGAPPTS